ncbi:MAG: isopentenyl-diphosphate delta-isomerase idi1 [Sclerophora amabilis]|nr:MAG: isopentenyl-diphosphate delta-isomerase idi1 [Sclerophora amabilis]
MGLSAAQASSMSEMCIVVDSNDKPLGGLNKEVCHRMENISQGLLHRAFSVFLFNTEGELLMQQRSSSKATFPDMWTNTCCSHPLASNADETGESLDDAIAGVSRAARRRLAHELGIAEHHIPLEAYKFITRIQYKSASGEGGWGEHETPAVDYILFAVADVDVAANPEEVQATKYVSTEHLREMLRRDDSVFTPWFKLVAKNSLFEWWEKVKGMKEKGSLKSENALSGHSARTDIVRM